MNSNWQSIVDDSRERLQKMHEAREAGLSGCRKLIQISSRSIRHVHRHQFAEAESLLQEARSVADAARAALRPFPELYYAGFLHDAEKELVEAAAVLAVIKEQPIPTPEALGAQVASYLNGMGEAASEVRRFALDEMRSGRLESAEKILQQMETIYDDLITFDFPDGMTGGLRRTCDALRAVIERTRSDLTTTASQQELIREMQATRAALEK